MPSKAVLLLLAGIVPGDGNLGLSCLDPGDPIVVGPAEVSLAVALFTADIRVGENDLRSARRLPERALLFGQSPAMAITAVLAYWLTGLGVVECLLLGAVLAAMDSVFAAALGCDTPAPGRLRRMLNVKSRLNDGLALPMVPILLGVPSQEDRRTPGGWRSTLLPRPAAARKLPAPARTGR